MDNGRYLRNTNPQFDYSDRQEADYTRDYGSGRDYAYSSARDYQAAGEYDRGRGGSRDYGPREYGYSGYADRDQRMLGRGQRRYRRDAGDAGQYRGSYGSNGHRMLEGEHSDYDRDSNDMRRGRPQGYDYQDRDFFARAGDEVRSWFGDEEAERRRDMDSRYDERYDDGRGRPYARDDHYHGWRRAQIEALDRDYDEYRRENRAKFDNEFDSWRNERQSQRGALSKVTEHMDVVGSDGEHVGTVDKVRGDRIILTRTDADAGGRHHSIPSRWIQSVGEQVTIRKTAADAHAHWRDEERNGALFPENRDNDAQRTRTPNGSIADRSVANAD